MPDVAARLSAVAFLVAFAGGGGGCTEARERPTVPVSGDLAIISDPPGASITVDGTAFSSVTPDTISVVSGDHQIDLELDAGGLQIFRFSGEFFVPGESLVTLDAALEGGCIRDCPHKLDRGRIVCRFNNLGDTCASSFFTGGTPALQWPGSSSGDYGSGGRLLIASILGPDAEAEAGDTLATQSFRQAYTGRAPAAVALAGSREQVDLRYWATARFLGETILGLEVEESLVAVDSASVGDILFVHYKITNVTADPRYQAIYPVFPESGYTFEELYLGFGLDADVGVSEDDLATFDPDVGLGFVYDADFDDPSLGSPPALVGLLSVEPPAGAARLTRTLWRRADDWDDGNQHGRAWRILAGQLGPGDPIPDHPDPDYGFFSEVPDDYRITEGRGPLTLAPGEIAEFTVALIFADPVAGTFTPGVIVAPGDPTLTNRAILTIASDLRSLAAEAAQLWDRYRP